MAGWAVPATTVRVVDLYGNSLPRDGVSIGEVVAQGDNVMAGYYREPEATEAVMRDGWFYTGDMAVWDEEGYVQIVDRKKEIIITGGENISSIEVERAIFAHDAVLECAVVAAPDEEWGETPAAIVVLKPGHSLSEGGVAGVPRNSGWASSSCRVRLSSPTSRCRRRARARSASSCCANASGLINQDACRVDALCIRFISNVLESEVEMLSSELWDEGATGIQEDSLPGARCQFRAWFEDPAGLLQRFDHIWAAAGSGTERRLGDESRQAWQPFPVGQRLYLAPEWDEGPTPRGRIRLTIHPGEALGTGAHPATQLCLEAMEALAPAMTRCSIWAPVRAS